MGFGPRVLSSSNLGLRKATRGCKPTLSHLLMRLPSALGDSLLTNHIPELCGTKTFGSWFPCASSAL